jgi:hypothetical protein
LTTSPWYGPWQGAGRHRPTSARDSSHLRTGCSRSGATFTYGPVESAALCRRQSSSPQWRTSASILDWSELQRGPHRELLLVPRSPSAAP